MPELPEVETVRRGLERLIVGRTIRTITHDTSKSFPNPAAEVEEFALGATVTQVRRRAKVLLIELSSDYTFVVHLKMTGQLVFVTPLPSSQIAPQSARRSPDLGPVSASAPNISSPRDEKYSGAAPRAATQASVPAEELRFGAGHPNDSLVGALPDKSTRVVIEFADGSHLYFNDQRKFGWMRLLPTIAVPEIDFMKKVGPEPLEDEFTAAEFIPRVRRRAGSTIKAAILDQAVLAGVGNIYADESLWAARIHPATRVRDLSDAQLSDLLREIKYVMNLSIEHGGSTDKNYIDAEGRRGSYLQFANVFRREGQACPRHPDVQVEKTRVAGRGTHICPVCQPALS